jgi:xylose isomerase
VQEALASAGSPDLARPTVEPGEDPDALKAEVANLDALGRRGYYNERLDQLVVEVLLGVR